MTKPFYKRAWFVSLLGGVLLTSVGFVFQVSSILAGRTADWGSGFLFGFGLAYIAVSGGFYNLEKKLDAKESQQKNNAKEKAP